MNEKSKKRAIAEKNRKMKEIQDILTYAMIGIGVVFVIVVLIYTFFIIL